MNTYQSTPDFYRDYIQHFNKNHDPKNGQFTSGHGGSSVNSKVKKARQTGKYDMEFLERGLDQDQRTGELLKGKALDDAYNKYLNEKEKKSSASYKTVKDLQNDKSLDVADFSYGETASKKVTDKDLNVISNLKKYQSQIEKVLKNSDSIDDIHNKLNNISDEINKNSDSSIDFRYSGFGSNGPQFDSYNTNTDVSITMFVKNKKMHIDLDDWS